MDDEMYFLNNCELEDILNGIDDKSEKDKTIPKTRKKYDTCPECNGIEFMEDYAKGIIYCKCGQVIDSVFDTGIESRNHDGDGDDKKSGGMIHNKLLPQSSLGTTVNAKGKLKQLHIWNAMPYKERSDNIMFKKIHEICVAQKIVKKIEVDAQILCKRVSGTVHKEGKNKGKAIITRGFNRSGIVAGCLFIACRRNNETRAVKEIGYYFKITEKDVNGGIRSLLDILDDDDIVKDIGTSKVIHFIQRKCDELHIKNKYTMTAKTIANNIDKLNIASNHTTYSLAAACILLMAEIHNLEDITKKRLSVSFCNLSDVTIGKTYSQIRGLRAILTSDIIVNEIYDEITRLKEKRIISYNIYEEMRRFNVDTSKYIVMDKHHVDNEKEGSSVVSAMIGMARKYELTNKINTNTNTTDNIPNENDNINDNTNEKVIKSIDVNFDDNINNMKESNDLESGDSYDDYAYMMCDTKNVLNELKNMKRLNEDAIDIISNINKKLNMVGMYIDQWITDIDN